MRRKAAACVLGLVALGGLGPSEASAGTRPPEARRAPLTPRGVPYVSLRILPATRAAVLRAGRVRVRLSSRIAARIRLDALVTRRTPGGSRVATRSGVRRRTVVLRRAGRRTLILRLTPAGRRALRACPRVELRVRAVPRRLRPLPVTRVRRRAASRLIVRHARRAFPAELGACRGGVLPGHPGPGGFSPESGYLVGMASRSINPGPDGRFAGQPVYLGGYGIGAGNPAFQGRPATGILGEGVHVRAIAVGDGRRNVAVADIEAQGAFVALKDGPYGLVDIRKEVARRSRGALTASRVTVQSDHTHSGPDLMGVWGGTPVEYRRMVFDRTVEAILEAVQSQREGTLYYGLAPGRDLLSNQFDYDAANAVVDSDVRVLQARDEFDRPFATLLNFSAHTTVLGSSNTKASGDWVQAANPLLAQRFGGEAVTVVATLGRTQPADRGCSQAGITGDAAHLCTIRDYAQRVVDRAAQAVASRRAIPGAPIVDGRSYRVDDVSTNAVLLGLLVAGAPVGVPINRAVTPPWLTGPVLGTVTASLRIGDVLMSTFPGEAYPQMALKVREKATAARGFMTAGLANDQLGYLIAPYEAYPEPIRRSFFNQRGDEISPIDNDNYFFNVSHTMGERVTCSALRGAGELFGRGLAYRNAHERCGSFPNDAALAPGADVG